MSISPGSDHISATLASRAARRAPSMTAAWWRWWFGKAAPGVAECQALRRYFRGAKGDFAPGVAECQTLRRYFRGAKGDFAAGLAECQAT